MPLLVGHLLDGIAEGGTRHLVDVLAEEIAQQIHAAAFTHLAKHPTYGLMHQVVGMVKVPLGIAQTPRRVTLLRCLPRADDAHALSP